MNARFRIVAPAAAALFALGTLPAPAQYSNEFTPAKLISQGKTTQAIAGSGTVVVQVQVNPDGTHKAVKVIHSTNAGDNAAAMDIAQNSSYRPAHRGATPIVSFYDFTLRFHGKSVAAASDSGGGLSTGGGESQAAAQVAALIRQGQYQQARSKAEAGLLSSPGDNSLREMLGIAAYKSGDYTAAASAFNKVPNIGSQFKPIAADALATAAVKAAAENPAQALEYAQKAVSLQSGADTNFSLGVAQLANNQSAAAVTSLKTARDQAMADSKIPVASKVNIDAELLQAYLATKDTANAQATAAQIKQLDPNSTAGARAIGNGMLKAGLAAQQANDTATALSDFDLAAASGDPQVAVTANTQAALAIAQSAKPDYKRMQAYAEKALAVNPNDAAANFAEGIALTAQWASSHDAGTKQKATDALNKADQQAKAEGNEALSLQIETFEKKQLNAGGGGGSGGGG
ncbi:MAG TPA: TonB family protein [Candidatus Nitrosotalea sp.]|nr:TonB family protein [Candidatus Nitrosotalea sp.]